MQGGEALKKPLAVQELEVKDKKGRARFHGAFTGGFSAGYFNTVGSKEGFTPSAFVSSKNKEKDVTISQEQKPEDFMDEEDFGEHGIAPRVVSATAEFGVKDGKRKIKETLEEAVLNDLIVPARTSMGFKLLRDLGWKDGQGIGARRKRMSKKKNEKGVKVYGCALPQSDSDESDGEFVPDHVTFAPKDVNPVKFQPKDNVHGLGYSGIKPGAFSANSHFSLFSERDPTRNVGKTKGIGAAGQAFGVGDFEDEDDVDVYATDDRNKYDKVLGGQGHQKNYGWTAPKHQGLSSAPLGYLGQVLEGFKLSKSTLKPKKTFPPPQLPKDFKPFHRREVSSQKKDNENTLDKKQTKHIDANVRQGMLGELKSVFHLLSESDKAKMQAAKTNTEKVLSNASEGRTNSRFTDECTSEQSVEKATTTKSTLCGGSTNFKPFACDPEKQKRYEQYLEATKNGKKELTEIPVGSMTEWERSKETEEFGRAARLYRPLAGMMASRFTKAKYQDNEDVVEVPADETANKSDQKKAVEMKMFGRLTRERFEWHPDRVLCKRFNVANPYPGNTMVGVPKVKRDKYSVFNFLNHPGEVEDQVVEEKQEDEMETEAADVNLKPLAILAQEDMSLQSTAQVKSLTSEIDQATLSSSTEDTGTRQLDEAVVVSERPAMDIFKAIFSDSSEEDGSSEEEADKTESDEPTESKTTPASRVLSSIFGRDSVIDKANNTKTSSASPPNSQQGSITVQSLSERLAPSDPMPHDTDPLTSQTVDCQCSNTQGTKNMSSQDLTSSASEAIDLCGPALPPGFSIGETQPHQVHPPGGGSSNRDRAGEEDRELWVVGADGQSHKTGNIDSSKVEKKKHKKHSVKKKKSKQHKKHKHKSSSDKKKKKHKKQKKKKEVVVISSTSSSSSDSEGSLSDQIIIDRLKNLPKGKRPTAVDFM